MSKYSYVHTTQNSAEAVLESLKSSLASHKFSVLHVHDIQAALKKNGIENEAYFIVEFCRAPVAKQVLDTNPFIGMLLPCRAVIFQNSDTTTVSALRPNVVELLFPDVDLGQAVEQVDNDIKSVMESLES